MHFDIQQNSALDNGFSRVEICRFDTMSQCHNVKVKKDKKIKWDFVSFLKC